MSILLTVKLDCLSPNKQILSPANILCKQFRSRSSLIKNLTMVILQEDFKKVNF